MWRAAESFPAHSGPRSLERTSPRPLFITFRILKRLSTASRVDTILLWGPERGHRPPLEPTEPTGGTFPGGFWTGWPFRPFHTEASLPPHAEVVAVLIGQIVEEGGEGGYGSGHRRKMHLRRRVYVQWRSAFGGSRLPLRSIYNRPIHEMCTKAEWMQGSSRFLQ